MTPYLLQFFTQAQCHSLAMRYLSSRKKDFAPYLLPYLKDEETRQSLIEACLQELPSMPPNHAPYTYVLDAPVESTIMLLHYLTPEQIQRLLKECIYLRHWYYTPQNGNEWSGIEINIERAIFFIRYLNHEQLNIVIEHLIEKFSHFELVQRSRAMAYAHHFIPYLNDEEQKKRFFDQYISGFTSIPHFSRLEHTSEARDEFIQNTRYFLPYMDEEQKQSIPEEYFPPSLHEEHCDPPTAIDLHEINYPVRTEANFKDSPLNPTMFVSAVAWTDIQNKTLAEAQPKDRNYCSRKALELVLKHYAHVSFGTQGRWYHCYFFKARLHPYVEEGDALKTRLLLQLVEQRLQGKSTDELKQDENNCKALKVIQSGQGCTTRLFQFFRSNVKTSASKAFDRICNEIQISFN